MATCEEIRERLPLAENDALVEAHLAGCSDCRTFARTVSALTATRPEPSHQKLVGFAARTRASANLADARSRRAAPWRTAFVAGTLAAAGAAVIALGLDAALPHVTPGTPVAAVAPVSGSGSDAPLPEDSLLDGDAFAEADEPAQAQVNAPSSDDEAFDTDEVLDSMTSEELSRLGDMLDLTDDAQYDG